MRRGQRKRFTCAASDAIVDPAMLITATGIVWVDTDTTDTGAEPSKTATVVSVSFCRCPSDEAWPLPLFGLVATLNSMPITFDRTRVALAPTPPAMMDPSPSPTPCLAEPLRPRGALNILRSSSAGGW